MNYKKENGVITINSGNPSFLKLSVWSCIMAAPVLWLLFVIIVQSEYNMANIFGICFLIVWLCIVLGSGKKSLRLAGQSLTISAEGVSIKTKISLKKPVFLSWHEISDYGYVYIGDYAFKGENKRHDLYILYFSRNELPDKKSLYRKKAENAEISFNFFNEDARLVTDYILPFCQNYAQCKRFGAENE